MNDWLHAVRRLARVATMRCKSLKLKHTLLRSSGCSPRSLRELSRMLLMTSVTVVDVLGRDGALEWESFRQVRSQRAQQPGLLARRPA